MAFAVMPFALALAVVGDRWAGDAARADVERRLERRATELTNLVDDHDLAGGAGELIRIDGNDVFLVRNNPYQLLAEGTSTVGLNLPQLSADAGAAGSSGRFQRIEVDGDSFLAFARAVSGGRVAIAATPADELDRTILLRRVLMAALIVGTCLAAWAVALRLLRRSKDAATLALVAHRRFLADAAHELRTPLSIVMASATQSLSKMRSTEEYVQSLAEIRGAAERASVAVGDLLDLARLEAGQVAPRRASLRLDLLVEEVIAATPCDDGQLTVGGADEVVVDADYALLRQAISNLVVNALKFAPRVEVATTSSRTTATVTVSDNGPGVPPQLLPTIFDRFHRGEGDRAGTGLGLAIVRSIVEAHTGTVEAANRPEGGAQFRIHLPRRDAAGG
jgi:two-component system, OmpR family, sensor kinase